MDYLKDFCPDIFSFAGCSAEKDVLIESQSSPDGNYTVLLYQVGEPQWPFGSVNAVLILENSDARKIDETRQYTYIIKYDK